jgi:hypothetical protein
METTVTQRQITIIFDDQLNMSDDEYADRGNSIWYLLKVAHPSGGFRVKSDGRTTTSALNARWQSHGAQCPWQ